jgi:tetratricopeptide (TPR) repeat protein
MPAHHKLEQFIDEYLAAAGIREDGKTPLFRSAVGKTGEATELVEKVAGDSILPRKIVDQIVAHTDGIPLFVEELTKSLLEGGVMPEENRRHGNGSLPPLAIPSSLHDLLLARLDRLAGAKGIAQVASALGRQFSYELLAAVAQWDDHRIQEALNQLAAAGLILRRGVAPHEYFTFKHALVQDAAYSTLLRDPRRGLHARITSVLNEQFPETGANEPEILAHHYTQAGLTDAAIAYWRKAGERALRRSANVEAVQHLTHGLALTPSLSDPAERERRELEFYLVLGPATRAINGHAAPETLNVFAGARDRLGEHATVSEKMSVLYGLFGVHFVRGEHAAAHAVACEAATLAMANADTDLPARADALMGHVLWAMGEFVEARVYLERALEMDSPDTRAPGDQRFSDNHRVAVLSFLAHTLWALGYPEQAVTASETAVARARSSGHVPLTAFALHGEAFLTVAFGADPVVGAQRADEAVSYCVEHGVTTYEQWDRFYQGMVSAERGYPRHGIEVMRRSIEAAAALHSGLLRPTHLGHLAIAYARNDQVEIGIQLLNDAIESIAQTRESLFEAELHRLRGELLSELGRESDAEIEFGRALSSARRQNARLWELRAAMSRAQLWRRQGRIPEAYELLLPIYDWFTEGFATPDLRSAKSLLTELH